MSDDFQKLLEALQAGGYDAKPSELRDGCVYEIVDITPIVEQAIDWSHQQMEKALFNVPEPDRCATCKEPVYMVYAQGEARDDTPVYCTRHSPDFILEHLANSPYGLSPEGERLLAWARAEIAKRKP